MSTLLGDYVKKNKFKAAIAVTAIHVGFVVLIFSLAESSYLQYFSEEPSRAALDTIIYSALYLNLIFYIFRKEKDQDTAIYCSAKNLDTILDILMGQGFSVKRTDSLNYACTKRRNIFQKYTVSIKIDCNTLVIEGMQRFLDPLMQFRIKYVASPHLRRVV
jgi:hypothetical protein